MIEAAEAEGRIEPGRTTIVEATSGNTGIALAFVCAAKGYDLILTLPQGMSREREGLLRLYGAQFQITESLGGMNEAVAAAQALARDDDVLAPRPVLQPRQPGRALPRHRPGAVGDARRRHRRARRRRRHRRDDHRRGRFLKERNPKLQVIGGRARRLAGDLRRAPGAAQDPGHRRGLRPAGARPRPARRGHRRRRRGRARDRAAARAPRGHPRRDLRRRRARTARCRWPSAGKARIAVVLPDSGERYVSTPFFAPEPAAAAR